MPLIKREEYLAHYGTPRKSGRYPWGSGKGDPRSPDFLDTVKLLKPHMTEKEIADAYDITTTQLRALHSIATNRKKQEEIGLAQSLSEKGWSNKAIGERMGKNESSVRSLLAPGRAERANNLHTIANMLRDEVNEKKYLDIGEGNENRIGINSTKLKTAVAILQEEGYVVHPVQVPQVYGGQNKTTVKVLALPGTTYRDAKANADKIQLIGHYSDDGGRSMLGIHPPIPVDPKRIQVVYGTEGKKSDGMIYVRRGVKDLSMGGNSYAQVRIQVGSHHYLKGMAAHKDDLPAGIDLQVHTPKKDTGNKLDAFKKLEINKETGKVDTDNPFKSTIRQITEKDEHGKERVVSALNMVGSQSKEGSGAEGSWDAWSRSLSTQVLSKQNRSLAQKQLDVTYESKKNELEVIKSLTNPTVRRELLDKFADSADSSAVHLKAAALPRQATQVLLPINSLKKNEIYAPNFKNGETVALIRYPHGGKFEIPVLTVNNGNREAIRTLGKQAKDSVGIHHSVAERLSGADFDGDTVVVIPNNSGHIKSEPALAGLKGFDPQHEYPHYEGMTVMKEEQKGTHMGLISNLITDMTIKGAPSDELARAVRHSMVVIDAPKHKLDFKRSEEVNGIKPLYKKYQGRAGGGGNTLISRAKSPRPIPLYKERSPREGGPIDPKTGKKVYRDQPEGFVNKDGVFVVKKHKVERLAATDDAFSLVSPDKTPIEVVYANHSNRLKALANEARKESYKFTPPKINPSAKKHYAEEVKSLNSKLNEARKNKPLERQAQIIANRTVALKKESRPDMDKDDLKKVKTQALVEARLRTGASKHQIRPTPSEWAAIQAGAVSYAQLKEILRNSDIDHIKELATPRSDRIVSSAKKSRALEMLGQDYTQAEVAEHLGISLSTLKSIID